MPQQIGQSLINFMKKLLFILLVFAAFGASAQDTTTYHRIPYTPIAIVINIPDLVVNGTKVKRTATLFTMTYNMQYQTLSLNWTIKAYADSSGSYSTYLGQFITNYSKESIADDNTFVNPQTGAFLYPDANGKYSMNYMGQYDFFNYLAETQPLKVHDLIRQYGMQVTNWDK